MKAAPGILFELTKFRICLVSALSAGTGYLACSRQLQAGLVPALAGTLLMAMGASALNEVQEHPLDARMERTRLRPIPRGAISPRAAAALGLGLAVAGFLLLLLQGWTPALLGLLALGWYNGLYTPLKRVSAFAVVPGSVIGALPPAMGWTAAGGLAGDPAILALGLFFFLWQVPHFWLLAMRYCQGYQQAGLPTLARHFSQAQIRRLIFTWTCATLAAGGLLSATHLVAGPCAAILLAGSLALLLRFAPLLAPAPPAAILRRAFLDINLFALLAMATIVLQALRA